ncbi:hypothetical protein C5746_34990 [Streptomyces atratus]|uniref:Uncharacterized protein n=2 Tax=Streptomyces atratus TaxID=1893 RepID=A0A2Z5JLF5_STRAR|nr:hypothetical protein C5746_34990 [Streptomyces atratus]
MSAGEKIPCVVITCFSHRVEGDGEARPVGLDCVDHCAAGRLIDGQQRPQLLFQTDRVSRPQDPAGEQGVLEREEGQFDLPTLVVEADQPFGGVGAVVQERRHQPVPITDTAPVGTFRSHVHLGDAKGAA